MKKLILLAGAALLPAAAFAAPPAQLPFDGFVSLGAGYNWTGVSGEGSVSGLDGLDLDGRATFAVPVSQNLGFQADAQYTRSVHDLGALESGLTERQTDVTGAFHLYDRPSDKGLVGIIGQVTSSNDEIKAGGESESFGPTTYYIGGEGQYYFNKVTLYGQAAYVSGANTGFFIGPFTSSGANGVVLNAQLRFYPQPNWMVTGLGGYTHVSQTISSTSLHDDEWHLGLKTEYRLQHHPISFFAQGLYTQDRFTEDGSSGFLKSHSFEALVGVKFNFGSHTLIERDHSGASLDPIKSISAFPFFGA